MSDTFERPTDRWGLIFHSSGLHRRAHTRQEWAQIADAIDWADQRHRGGERGGDAWCATAANTFRMLRDVDAHAQLRTDNRPVWHADERLIRAWLGAPSIPADRPGQTVLHDYGWHHALDPNRPVDPADLTMLVDLAQDAGVVGEPHHKVSLLRWVRDGVFSDDAFLVLVWRPDRPALPSDPVALDQLTGGGRTATDRAVAVLSGVATVANRLLAAAPPDRAPAVAAAREPAVDTVHEQPLRHGGNVSRLVTGADPPALPPPPLPPPRPPRHPRAEHPRPATPTQATSRRRPHGLAPRKDHAVTDDIAEAEQIADQLLPLGGPYDPDAVIETARTIAELVRRLNHATFNRSALAYPPQLYRTVSSLRSGLYGMQQTFGQLAARLNAFATDPRVGHDTRRDDPATACLHAAHALHQAAAALRSVTGPLDTATQITSHLDYNPTGFPRPARIPPAAPATPPMTDPPTRSPHRQRSR